MHAGVAGAATTLNETARRPPAGDHVSALERCVSLLDIAHLFHLTAARTQKPFCRPRLARDLILQRVVQSVSPGLQEARADTRARSTTLAVDVGLVPPI